VSQSTVHCSKDEKIIIFKAINLAVALCGCETSSLMVFENRMLRGMFGRSDRKVERMHNEELRYLYSSPRVIRMIKARRTKWAGHVARRGDRNAYRLLLGNSERKRPLGRPRHNRMDNIKMDFEEIGWGVVNWIDLAQDMGK
jgi:hypothetical protein